MATVSGSLSPAQIAGYAQAAGFTGGEIAIATAIAMAESDGNPNAHNNNAATGDDSYGLWQINMLGSLAAPRRLAFGITSNEQLFDPMTNAKAARHVRMTQGWTAWSVYNGAAFRNALPAATVAANAPTVPSGDTSGFGNPLDALNPAKQLQAIIDKLLEWIKEQFLRVSMFIGGGFLVFLGVQIFVASKVAPKALDVLTSVKGAATKAGRLAK